LVICLKFHFINTGGHSVIIMLLWKRSNCIDSFICFRVLIRHLLGELPQTLKIPPPKNFWPDLQQHQESSDCSDHTCCSQSNV